MSAATTTTTPLNLIEQRGRLKRRANGSATARSRLYNRHTEKAKNEGHQYSYQYLSHLVRLPIPGRFTHQHLQIGR